MPDLDRETIRELARLLDERLRAVDGYGGACGGCRDAEAHAFLARLRAMAGEVKQARDPAPALATAGVRRRR